MTADGITDQLRIELLAAYNRATDNDLPFPEVLAAALVELAVQLDGLLAVRPGSREAGLVAQLAADAERQLVTRQVRPPTAEDRCSCGGPARAIYTADVGGPIGWCGRIPDDTPRPIEDLPASDAAAHLAHLAGWVIPYTDPYWAGRCAGVALARGAQVDDVVALTEAIRRSW